MPTGFEPRESPPPVASPGCRTRGSGVPRSWGEPQPREWKGCRRHGGLVLLLLVCASDHLQPAPVLL